MPSLFCKMGLIEQAQTDIRKITSNLNDFGVPLFFESPTGDTATIAGFHSKHHLKISTEGAAVNGRNAHVSFSEKLLTDLSYPVRNGNSEVDLKGHKVTAKDSTGIDKKYVIEQYFQDETVGLIVCILGQING